jgi:gliding motility-associated-like protein
MKKLILKSQFGFTEILLTIFFLNLLFPLVSQSLQQGCPNANLSMNNFTGWTGYTGTFSNPGATLGIVNGRHTIITSQGMDPNTCNGLPMIPPGYTRSIRLGNAAGGKYGEKISYQITVSQANALFIYKYAVVLEDPDHSAVQQPNFEMRLKNAAGQQINGNCGIYTVYAGQQGQNFQNCNGISWLPWKTVGVNLSSYMGQTITIEFTTRDCSLGAHFGYAYLVAECMPLYINMDYCQGSSQVQLTAPIGFQNYQWTPGGATTPSITINSPNNNQVYTCTMNSVSNQGNCPVSISTQLTPTIVTANFNHTTGCVFVPIQFNSTSTVSPTVLGGITLPNNVITNWTWIFGNGYYLTGNNPTIHMNPLHIYPNAGVYTVTHIVTTAGGCSDTIVQNILVGAPPQANFNIVGACQNDTIQFQNQSSVPCTFSWNFMDGSPNSNQINPQHIYSSPGSYNVSLIATNPFGCIDTSYQNLIINAPPTIQAGNDTTLCLGDGIVLNASGGTTYSWQNNIVNGTQYFPSNSSYISVTGTDINGCANKDSLFILLHQLPLVNAGLDQFACFGSPLTLQGSGAVNYQWDGGITNGVPQIITVGTHLFTVTGTDTNSCIDTDTMSVVIYPNPIVNAGNDQLICAGNSVNLSGTGAQTYQWNNNITNTLSFVPLATANYTVIGTDSNGCVDEDSVTVSIEAITNVSFMAPITEGCVPLEVTFNNTSIGNPGVTTFWDFGDGENGLGNTSIDHTYNTPGCYDVQLTITTALGCIWTQTINDYICVFPNPIATFSPYPIQLSEALTNSNMNNNTMGATTYYWDFGDGSMPTSNQDPNHEFPGYPPTNYTILLTATNEHGCIDTMTQTVIVNPSLLIYIPNTFTPDGDQFNQNWLPIFSESVDPYNYELLLFDRWGETIWESHNLSVGWDGTYGSNGIAVQDGSYTYKISYKLRNDAQREIITGHVNLMR